MNFLFFGFDFFFVILRNRDAGILNNGYVGGDSESMMRSGVRAEDIYDEICSLLFY